MELVLILLLLLLGAALGPLSARLPEKAWPWTVPVPAGMAFLLLGTGNLSGVTLPWIPSLGIEIVLRSGGISLLMALLVTGIGTLILLYATEYMRGHPQAARLFTLLYAFMLAMTGLILSDHLLVLFVFWELTSVTSYLLIGFNHADPTARRNALQSLLVTGLGGLALLGGLILMREAGGSWLISDMVSGGIHLGTHPLYGPMLVLVLIGALTKSAQFPFHFWLPNAMSAPTPVSAYLHSATMVKAGVFLLAILHPILGGTTAWTLSLTLTGATTLLVGGIFGLRETDLKRILASTTLAVLGLLVLLIGLGTQQAMLAMVLFLTAHALYKATLFMVAGAVDHATGTRDVRQLGGLARAMPFLTALAALAALSKMGLPPFVGFIGKEYVYKASLYLDHPILVSGILLAGNALLVALALKVAILPFWGARPATVPGHPHDPGPAMLAGPAILAALGCLVGVMPGVLEPLASSALRDLLGRDVPAVINLWEGFNLPLLLSVLTVACGLLFFWFHKHLRATISSIPAPSAAAAYEALLAGILRMAEWQTRLLQSGYLRRYLAIILTATTLLIANKLWRYGGIELPSGTRFPDPGVLVVGILILAGILLAIITERRLAALLGLGLVGFGIAYLFAWFSAPDLAVTQILVETLTVALFAWVIHKLPAFRDFSNRRTKLLDAAVAGLAGILVTLLVLKSKALEISPSISETLSAWSGPEAHGSNVVNVILVDFRALDTWGEITVLAIAALGVWALLGSLTRSGKEPKA